MITFTIFISKSQKIYSSIDRLKITCQSYKKKKVRSDANYDLLLLSLIIYKKNNPNTT